MQYLKDITGWPKPIVLKSFSPYNTKEEEEAFKKIEAENLKAACKAQIRSTNLINYLQKALGYSLTSDTSERTTFITYGPTKTGKSTLLNTIKDIIREYSGKLMVSTLFNKYDSLTAQANLAGLKGARFAMCSELPKSDDDSSIKLNSQIIKHLVQGSNSTMPACKKGENPIEFLQTHKIWIDTNFLPDFKGDDEALWNRLTPIPFMTQFEGSEDKYLYQRLLDEAEGILAWLIEGAYKWRQEGLIPPPEIQEAINEWKLSKDPILRFVNQCCVVGPNKKCKARRLYNAYKQWSEESEVEAISLTAFGLKISSLGYVKKKISDIIYLGIGLAD
jgi:putative DNA primase/helicase